MDNNVLYIIINRYSFGQTSDDAWDKNEAQQIQGARIETHTRCECSVVNGVGGQKDKDPKPT